MASRYKYMLLLLLLLLLSGVSLFPLSFLTPASTDEDRITDTLVVDGVG